MVEVTKDEIARRNATALLEIEAVHFNADTPFTLASGKPSPVYIDCRKIISFPKIRTQMMDDLALTIRRELGDNALTNIAGGETAGIPFAAFVAERLGLPMSYVRKKPKGYGRNARIEGVMGEGDEVLLVEDLTTDGGSKISFVEAIRDTGATCQATAVVFFYGIFDGVDERLQQATIRLLYLTDWWHVLNAARESGGFAGTTLSEVESFLKDPHGWQAARA
ncbi:MAG: orotate phosphoribosyltransferase [Pseudomonadota bacterium]